MRRTSPWPGRRSALRHWTAKSALRTGGDRSSSPRLRRSRRRRYRRWPPRPPRSRRRGGDAASRLLCSCGHCPTGTRSPSLCICKSLLYTRHMEAPPGSGPSPGWTGKHAVELYVRTYTTMLQSSGDIKVESLVQAHLGMGSVLHPLAAQPQSDMGALLYAVRRLPAAIASCRRIIMGQSPQGFRAVLGAEILSWEAVKAPARRRRWYHDDKNTLAVLIASKSDIDDLVPTVVAFQIEWNKLHRALQEVGLSDEDSRHAAGATPDDWRRLHDAWGENFDANLAAIKRDECRIVLRLIGGSHLGYARNASRCWMPVAAAMDDLGARDAPIYFVSSNAHRLVNVLTGVARRIAHGIVGWIGRSDRDLDTERRKLAAGVAGVYVLGKAATLNADVGDVMIPNVVYNEHSGNTYWLDNCFTASDVQPNLVYGSALDNQRAVTVRGTFLQNRDYLDFYYQGRYTVVEMEAGPYLDACFEIGQPDRYPVNESVNMAQVNFDLGIVHYASDTPYTQARTLGARGLSYRGMDSTYASAIAVARRILQREEALLPQK